MRRIPVDAKRGDWPRLVADTVNKIIGRLELDPVSRAETTVLQTYGDTVSVAAKGKNLNKFGRNASVETAWETVAVFQDAEINETFVSTNLIDSAASTDNGDTQTITIEGHTIDASGNLTFVSQNVTLTGQTEKALTTPLARATQAFVANSGTFDSPQSVPAGDIAIYDNTGVTLASGKPDIDAAVKLMISAGNTQTEKAADAIGKDDYWFINYLIANIGDATGPTNFATVRMEIRDIANGGVWRPIGGNVTLWPDTPQPPERYDPPLIVPKNHDWRVRAKADGGTTEIYAEAGGYLAAVQ